jgi:hypothetical protein
MDTNRRPAVVAGVLLIVATVVDVISRAAVLTPILTAPDPLAAVSANGSRVALGALLLLLGAISAGAIAIAMYPVLRRYGAVSALGSVGFRLIEATLYLGIVVCLLVLVAVGREAASPGDLAAFEAPAALVLAARDALGEVAVLSFGLGAGMYYWVFYRSRLVPRWLSAWGLLAVAAVMVSSVLVIAGVIAPMSQAQVVLALPIGLQEMVLAAWLIARGFCTANEATSEARSAAAVAVGSVAGAPAASR